MKEEMKRHNEGKPQISYLGDIKEALEELCQVFASGAEKYGRNNWKKGGPPKAILDSLGRHFLKLAAGTELDEESGYHHAAHIAWNALAYIQLKHDGRLKMKEWKHEEEKLGRWQEYIKEGFIAITADNKKGLIEKLRGRVGYDLFDWVYLICHEGYHYEKYGCYLRNEDTTLEERFYYSTDKFTIGTLDCRL